MPAPAKTTKRDLKADGPLLVEIRERFQYCVDQWRDIRDEATTDMRFVAGDTWTTKDRKARDEAGRPCLSLDELGQFTNQLINEVRQRKRAIQVSPIGSGANDKTAELRAGILRQIEYRSNAQMAYTTMFENAVQRSYGFLRINAQYLNDKGFDQELLIEPIVNPDMVWIDPDILKPTGSDMRYAFVAESWDVKDFRKRFPRAQIRDFSAELVNQFPSWIFSDKRIQLAEYWKIETTVRRLYRFEVNGQEHLVFDDDERFSEWENLEPTHEREVETPAVRQYLTNGVEVLKETEWPGKWIPIVSCFGKVLYFDKGEGTKRTVQSMIRLARDPAQLYNYYRTNEAELVGMTPKVPFIGYEGQFGGHESEWQEVNQKPKAYLEAKAQTESTGSVILPLPQRQPYDPPIQALEVGAESARRAIQAAIGSSPLPTQAQRRNEKSGIALRQIEDAQQKGSFHFIDHYDEAITRVGEILNDLLDSYYDTPRDVTLRTPADETKAVRVNDPEWVDPKTNKPTMLRVPEGQHDITLSTGPSYDSEREAASDFADTLAQNPAVFGLIADLVVKLKNLGPIGDEIADRLTPPQFKKQADGKPPVPPELMKQMQQAQQMVDLLTKELEAKTREVEIDQAKANVDLEKAKIDAATKLEIAKIQAQASVVVAELKAQSEDLGRRMAILEQMIGVEGDVAARRHEALSQQADHAHELGLTQMSAAQAREQQASQQAHELTAADLEAQRQQQMAAGEAGEAVADTEGGEPADEV